MLSFELSTVLFALRYEGPALPFDTLFELPPTFPSKTPTGKRHFPGDPSEFSDIISDILKI